MIKDEKINKIYALVKSALDNTDIKNDKKLSLLLIRIQETSINGELFYDYKKELQPAISMYSIQHNFRVPDDLVKLLALVQTPKAWSGF